MCTSLHCTATKDTFELWAEVITLAHFNGRWQNNQLGLDITQISIISDNTGKAFTAPMRELVNKYADVFTKPGKPIARDIKHKIELLYPEKPIAHYKLQIISETDI